MAPWPIDHHHRRLAYLLDSYAAVGVAVVTEAAFDAEKALLERDDYYYYCYEHCLLVAHDVAYSSFCSHRHSCYWRVEQRLDLALNELDGEQRCRHHHRRPAHDYDLNDRYYYLHLRDAAVDAVEHRSSDDDGDVELDDADAVVAAAAAVGYDDECCYYVHSHSSCFYYGKFLIYNKITV